jgi:lysophospholipase L1-like esterase
MRAPGVWERDGMKATFTSAILAFAVGILSLAGAAGAARSEPVVIAAIGDSNVAGKGVSPSEAYPAKLERALRAKGYDVRVINAGMTTDTTQGVLSRLDSAVPQGTRIAIVWVGINDLRAGVPPATVEADRQTIANRLRARGIKVLLLGPRHGLGNSPQFLLGDAQKHLNPAGYDQIVARTLPQVQALIGSAKSR